MIKCTCCNEEKEVGEFSPQVKNPAKLYRWCDSCRKNAKANRPNRGFAIEIESLRNKCRERMRFDAKEAKEIRILSSFGLSNTQIAVQYNVSPKTVGKVVTRQGLYSEI